MNKLISTKNYATEYHTLQNLKSIAWRARECTR